LKYRTKSKEEEKEEEEINVCIAHVSSCDSFYRCLKREKKRKESNALLNKY